MMAFGIRQIILDGNPVEICMLKSFRLIIDLLSVL